MSRRDLTALPKAHLHLHFTGSMRHTTLIELAARDGIHLPDALVEDWPPVLSAADEKGWFRFQRLYDVARSMSHAALDFTVPSGCSHRGASSGLSLIHI